MREDVVGNAPAGRLDDHLGGLVRQLERAHRADAVVDDRAAGAARRRRRRSRRAMREDGDRLGARQRSDADRLGRVQVLHLGVVHRAGLGRHVSGADRDLVGVDVGQVVVQAGDVADVGLGRVAELARPRVDHADALAEVGEGDAARLEHDVVLRLAAAEHDLARAPSGSRPRRRAAGCAPRASRGRRRSRRPEKMSSASSASTNTPVRSSTSSVAEWMSSTSASVKTFRRRPPLRGRPAKRLRFTRAPPVSVAVAPTCRARERGATRSLNWRTQLMGTSSTSAMWNLASIEPGSLG